MRPKAAVTSKSPEESFWSRWARDVVDRLEDWKIAVLGLVSVVLALLGELVVIGVSAVAVALVLSWAVVATWIAQRDEARAQLQTPADDVGTRRPQLSFGVPVVPVQTQRIDTADLRPDALRGRVIRVPVTNAPGAGKAFEVHAVLRFSAGNTINGHEPFETQAEWVGEPTGWDITVDLVGNGRKRWIDVVVVLDWDYPHAYEWTERSRAAGLDTYGIEATPFEVLVEVQGVNADGEVVCITDSLVVGCWLNDTICADWVAKGDHSNCVAWPKTWHSG